MRRGMPKYMDVASWLKEQIGSNGLKLGDRLYSENELSERFGLSRQTIRQAIGILEKERIVERRQGSGTYVIFDGLKKREPTKNIGVISTYLDSYIFPSIMRGIDSVLSANGYTVQLTLTHNQVENESRCLRTMLEKEVDGIIAEPTKSGLPNPNSKIYEEILKRKIPLIFFNAYYPETVFPHVSMDDRAAGKMAAQCLIDAGHKRIAGMFQSDDSQGHLRYAGYVEALLEAGIEIHSRNVLWFTTEDIPFIIEDFNRVKRLVSGCTGLVCYNDQIAFQIINELCKLGDVVPNELSVVGIDDAELASICSIPITTVRNSATELGQTVAENLLKLIEDPSFNATVDFQPKLIKRASVRELKD